MSSQTLMNYLAGGAVEHDTPPLLLGELGLLRGVVRADLTLVGSAMLHGVEVKTARDSLRRLPQQVAGYSRVFHRVTLAAEACHILLQADVIPAKDRHQSVDTLLKKIATKVFIGFKGLRTGRIRGRWIQQQPA